MKLRNRVIVITGSSRGIGKAIAEACCKEGGKVVISSRNRKNLEKTHNEFLLKNYSVTAIPADVAKEDEIKNLIDQSVRQLGRIDVWINNAGISGGYRFLDDIPSEELKEVINVNILGTLISCRLIIPYFIKNNGGIVLNISGRGGKLDNSAHQTAYGLSKAAVTSLTKSLAREYKEKPVSIHSVFPGMVDTDFFKDIKVSKGLENRIKNISLVLNSIGVPLEVVGQKTAEIASQTPGKITGKQYSFFRGYRKYRGILMLIWYRISGKIKG